MASETAKTTTGGKLSVTIVAPSGQVAHATDVDTVIAPGLVGEFGVLPGHVPLLAALKAGVLAWGGQTGRKHLLAVDKGYLQVGAENRVIVMVEAAMEAGKVDVTQARADQEAATATLKAGGDDPVALTLAQERLEWANARLAATAAAAGAATDKH